MFTIGCARVYGELAVSRAFGDCRFKQRGVHVEQHLDLRSPGDHNQDDDTNGDRDHDDRDTNRNHNHNRYEYHYEPMDGVMSVEPDIHVHRIPLLGDGDQGEDGEDGKGVGQGPAFAVVLATDGLWDRVRTQELSSRQQCSLESLQANRLVRLARGRGSRDDITVLVVRSA